MKLKNIFPENISAIVFDFGGVILDVDLSKTVRAFEALGVKNLSAAETQVGSGTFFEANERGDFTRAEFWRKLRERAPELGARSDAELHAAWDELLGNFVPERISLLRELRKNYRTFLLSNTNEAHRETFLRRFSEQIGGDMNALFEQAFYSDLLRCVKPSHEIFEKSGRLPLLCPRKRFLSMIMRKMSRRRGNAAGMRITLCPERNPFLICLKNSRGSRNQGLRFLSAF